MYKIQYENASITTYLSEIDDTLVVHVDTHGEENENGPIIRIFLNDDTDNPLFDNPKTKLESKNEPTASGENAMKRLSQEVKQEIKALLIANLSAWREEAAQSGTDTEGMCADLDLIVATNDTGTLWGYQTGDNNYTGACYRFQHWAFNPVRIDTDIDELYDAIVVKLESLLPDNR
jgi:hypothetical protein